MSSRCIDRDSRAKANASSGVDDTIVLVSISLITTLTVAAVTGAGFPLHHFAITSVSTSISTSITSSTSTSPSAPQQPPSPPTSLTDVTLTVYRERTPLAPWEDPGRCRYRMIMGILNNGPNTPPDRLSSYGCLSGSTLVPLPTGMENEHLATSLCHGRR